MKPIFSVITVLFTMMVTSVSFAAPTFANLSTADVGAGMATLVMQSNEDGTGYFTLLTGSNPICGTSAQVKDGKTAGGTAAPYFGSLPLAANVEGRYTVRNLAQSTGYTACVTADGSSGTAAVESLNFTTSAATAFTGLDWREVGSAGFSAGAANFTSLAFAPDGTPYVAYADDGNNSKATVMKYSGGVWSLVGSAGFSAGTANSTSLAFAPDGTPHVAYSDYGNSGKATVMKFSGGVWSVVGTAGFSASQASNTSLAFAPDGTPHVAYGGDDYNNSKATVMKFSGASWSVVGSAEFSAGTANFTSLAFAPDGAPLVAYSDYGNSGKVTVMKFSGGVWSNMGNPGFSAFDAGFTSLAIAPDGTPHVAYSDYGNSGNATVMKYNGGVWGVVGNAGFSAGTANSTSLAFAPDGTPFVAYYDAGITGKAMVMNYSGSVWSVVGSAEFSAGTANFTSLAFAPDGIPHVVYGDDGNSSKATVMKLRNALTISGTPATTATVGIEYSFTPTATHADSFSVTGTLPPGLSFNTTTGTLSGIPTTVDTYSNIVITAANSLGSASLPAFSITVSDPAPPDTTITSFPADPSSSTSFSFSFTSTVSGSTFECSLRGGPYDICSSPYSDSIVYAQCTTCRIDTAMSFAVRAKGPTGNTDPTPASYAWTINHPFGVPFDNVLDGGVIQLRATDLTGDLNFSRGIAFALKGGYDSGYSANSGWTNIHGTVTISAGTVTFENIIIM